MQSFYLTLLELPSWVIAGLVGAIAGGIGGLLGGAIERVTGWKSARVALVAVCAAAAASLTSPVIIPALLNASMNADLPKKLDEITTMTRVQLNNKRYVYDYDLSDASPDVNGDELKSQLLGPLCNHWKPIFASGDVLSAEYRYSQRGKTFSFVVEPLDCN